MKILAIDDEFAVLRQIRSHLQKQKWQVEVATNYSEAQKKILSEKFDVVICDHLLSEQKGAKDGLDLINRMRSEDIATPVIVLTGQMINVVSPWEALDIGVDDFMKKPYHMEELVARIKAVVRRNFASKKNFKNIIKLQ